MILQNDLFEWRKKIGLLWKTLFSGPNCRLPLMCRCSQDAAFDQMDGWKTLSCQLCHIF